MYKIAISAKTLIQAEIELGVEFLNKKKTADDNFAPVEIRTNSAILYGYLLEKQHAEMFPK